MIESVVVVFERKADKFDLFQKVDARIARIKMQLQDQPFAKRERAVHRSSDKFDDLFAGGKCSPDPIVELRKF